MLIADFGISKEESLATSNSLLRGTPGYIDPQCHIQDKYIRNKKSDIFSFGMILWEISSEREPFVGDKDYQVVIKISRGAREERVDGTPESYFRLYTKCWDDEPNNRPDIEEVVETLENYDTYSGVYYPNGPIPTIQPPPFSSTKLEVYPGGIPLGTTSEIHSSLVKIEPPPYLMDEE